MLSMKMYVRGCPTGAVVKRSLSPLRPRFDTRRRMLDDHVVTKLDRWVYSGFLSNEDHMNGIVRANEDDKYCCKINKVYICLCHSLFRLCFR